MRKVQQNKFEMEQTIDELLVSNREITKRIPGFDTIYTPYKENLNKISDLQSGKSIKKHGLANHNHDLHQELAKKGYNLCSFICAYATISNNTILKNEFGFTEYDLNKSNDNELNSRINLICNKAESLLELLHPYGVTPETIASLRSLNAKHVAMAPNVRMEKSMNKETTKQIEELFKANDALLGKFDSVIEILRDTQPEFYRLYKINRIIPNKGTTTISLITKVQCGASGDPIKGAKATITLVSKEGTTANGASAKPLIKKTAEKGSFRVRNLAPGTYTITIEKAGYATVTMTIHITKGENTLVKVTLNKS